MQKIAFNFIIFVTILTVCHARYDFPVLTGKYRVASSLHHLIDQARAEPHVSDASAQRELIVEIFYPCHVEKTANLEVVTLPYDPVAIASLKKDLVTGGVLEKHLRGLDHIYTQAINQITPAVDGSPFPLILFSHGLWLARANNTSYAQELASHGYIVACIGHTYASALTIFPDGRMIECNDFNLCDQQQMNDEHDVWVADYEFVIKTITAMNNDEQALLFRLIDLEKVGVVGHSFGGSVAAQLCRSNDKLKAGVNLDGAIFGDQWQQPCQVPFMTMQGGLCLQRFEQDLAMLDQEFFDGLGVSRQQAQFLQERYANVYDVCSQSEVDTYYVIINGADHLSFTDAPLLKRSCFMLGYLDFLTGTIEGLRMNKVVNDYLVNFFDHYLKQKPSELLEAKKSPHKGVSVKRFGIKY